MTTEHANQMAALVAHLRWCSREGRGGMDAYVRVRDAAYRDAFGRAASELEQALPGGNEALLRLASDLRQRSLDGAVPAGVRLPQWPKAAPTLDETRVRRAQQLGFSLGLTRSAALIHEAAGGEF